MSDKNALSIFGKKRTLKALTEFATNRGRYEQSTGY